MLCGAGSRVFFVKQVEAREEGGELWVEAGGVGDAGRVDRDGIHPTPAV
jgi:hypothetical protein